MLHIRPYVKKNLNFRTFCLCVCLGAYSQVTVICKGCHLCAYWPQEGNKVTPKPCKGPQDTEDINDNISNNSAGYSPQRLCLASTNQRGKNKTKQNKEGKKKRMFSCPLQHGLSFVFFLIYPTQPWDKLNDITLLCYGLNLPKWKNCWNY